MTLHDFVVLVKDYSAVLWLPISLLLLVLIIWWYYVPSIRLLWCCLSQEQRFPLLHTIQACGIAAWPFKPASFSKQIRLWLELRILNPRPEREPDWVLDPKTKRYTLIQSDSEFNQELTTWLHDIRGKFSALKLKDKEPLIELNNVFSLNNEVTKNRIKQYLLAVDRLNLAFDESASFLCKIKINDGFLLPLNLLAGLMAHFSDDWDPIISAYSRLATKSFSSLQMSIFDLWLLWGPSVPICTCVQWSGPVTLQYGYGDENNSVRVRVTDKNKKAILDEFRTQVNENQTDSAFPALHTCITARLWPPSSFFKHEFCGAQHEHADPNNESFILEYEQHAVTGNPPGGYLYYTAYVWAMFVVGRDVKPTLSTIRTAPWLHVVPFFEHANIVDGFTYEAAKQQLAHKVIHFLKQCDSSESDPSQQPVRLWYSCAFDDSGCGHTLEVKPGGMTIRDMLAEIVNSSTDISLPDRIILDDSSFAEVLSACHLSDMLAEYFTAIETG